MRLEGDTTMQATVERERNSWIRCGRRCTIGRHVVVIDDNGQPHWQWWFDVTLPGAIAVGNGQSFLTREAAVSAANACAIRHFRATHPGPWRTGEPGRRPV